MTATARNQQLEAIVWLTRLPFLGIDELALVLGVTKPQAARTLGELERLGWVEWVTPSSTELDQERLYTIADRSFSELAVHLGLTESEIQSFPLGRKETLERLTGLETTVGLNLFAAELVAAARDDVEVELEDMRSVPWGRRRAEAWWPPEMEGYGCLRWGAWRAPFFVAWDRAGAPPFHRRKRVAAWYAFWNAEHAWGRDDIPPILVLHPGAEEAEQWAGAVLRASDRRQVAPLHVFLSDAESALSEGPLGAVWRRTDGTARAHLCERLVWRLTIPPAAAAIRIADPARPLEALSRDGPSLREWVTQAVPSKQEGEKARGGQERLAALSLVTNTTEKRILEWLGHHPLLSADDLAVILRLSGQLPVRLLDSLARYGLVESTGKALEAEAAPSHRYYLTGLGLKLLAARDGVPPRRYARHGSVAALMPGKKGGGRLSTLLRQLDHTVGVNRFFVRLIQDGAKGRPRLVRWLSASEAAQKFTYGEVSHWLRPDGAGDVHLQGRVRRFYLEWDRGTVKLPDLVEKCRLYAAYYAYLARAGAPESRRPSALVVTSSPLREGVLWRAILTAFDEVKASPCYFFTTVDTLIGRAGPLAPVWRRSKDAERNAWL